MRKIDVPTDSVPEFELGDTVADIQQRKEENEARERVKEAEKQERKPGGRKLHTQQWRECQKSVQRQTKVTQKWIHAHRLEQKQAHLSHTQEGAHDQHLSDGLRGGDNCRLCEGLREVLQQDQ